MKQAIIVLAILCIVGCSKKPSLNAEDIAYVQTTVDLLHVRANFATNMDSAQITFSLDTVYRRHRTAQAEYRNRSAALADDPKHAEAVFSAISDSISKQ